MDDSIFPPCDWFSGMNFTMSCVHGFFDEPFKLPVHIKYTILALNFLKQLSIVDAQIGASIGKSMLYQYPITFNRVTLDKRKVEYLLDRKLILGGLDIICDTWECDLDGCLRDRQFGLHHRTR